HLRPMSTEQGDVNQFYVVQPALIPDCGGQPEAPEIRHDAEALFAEGSTLNKIAGPATAVGDEPEALLSGRALVDLLVVYTPAVRAALGSEAAVRVQLDLGVAKVNSDFARSGITARLRLADTMELPYPDDSLAGAAGYQSTALERLRGTRDGWFDEVHARRDEVGADLVTLVVNRADPTSSGIGYLVKDPRGYEASFSAFSVVNTAYVSGDGSVLSHELGHNFGCAHARSDPGATGTADGAFAYSYGYRFSAVDDTGATRRLRTIMAYNTADGGYARVPYFSNPRLTLASFGAANFPIEPPLGVADGVANAADNARTIEAVAFQVGNYRISADYSAAGNLVNVSTRAYVATGARAMFGGFVISGEGPKRVLLRAVGPTLGRAPYNVPGVLNDPVLRVYRGGTLLAENDDWGRDDRTGQAGYAAQVSAANERAGAFPLLEGARDAALLLELESGAYSAVVTGKGDAVGEALVEAYELGRDGSRLINLSTRAFGSRENPIIAGFVVTADPERPHQRKRMLVRVLGPSLAAYGLAAADLMQDPVMQVYGADGQLVLENDDWDSPSTTLVGGDRVSIATLTRGQVDQYSEKLVYAAVQHTGVSMHPVEPAVIVELAPGAYSVRVQPFANARNPPSEPGIAIIEVYELAGDGR
ncbi:MAG TPA: M12 family metallo-peptidase, partial [Candidatus Synoicihabitans sp.]|nr:M12 family metallo-peptidase [Candidatus Synoicihabitans sp.]